nr:hypothetical protein [Amycolatopsis nivea]
MSTPANFVPYLLLGDAVQQVGDEVGEDRGDRDLRPEPRRPGQAEPAHPAQREQEQRAQAQPDQHDLPGRKSAQRQFDPQEAGTPEQRDDGEPREAGALDGGDDCPPRDARLSFPRESAAPTLRDV